MAKVKIQGNASGTGTLTLTAPNTNADRIITLPDEDITLGGGVDGIVSTANATAITIDSSENVGIGVATPESLLTVGANVITTLKPTLAVSDTSAGGSITIRGGSPILFFDKTGASAFPTILTDTGGLQIKDGTLDSQGTTHLAIDSAGRVTMPYQPAFSAKMNNGSGNGYLAIGNNTTVNIVPNLTLHNTGGHYSTSTGKFTAPVTGTYYMYGTIAWQPGFTATHGRLALQINGAADTYQDCSNIYQRIQGTGAYFRMFVTHVMKLSANDTVHMAVIQDSGSSRDMRKCMTEFSGYLIG